jgi:hypothetical protein
VRGERETIVVRWFCQDWSASFEEAISLPKQPITLAKGCLSLEFSVPVGHAERVDRLSRPGDFSKLDWIPFNREAYEVTAQADIPRRS